MANPPITIGPFTNVPAPGSPIKSDWPQSVSTYVDRRPRGSVGFARGSGSDQTGVANVDTDLTGYAVTYPQVTGRVMVATLNLNVSNNGTALGSATVQIATNTNTTLVLASVTIPANAFVPLVLRYVFTVGSTGTGSIKARGNAGAGGGTLTIVNSVSRNGFLSVEDLGYPYP